MADNMPMPMQWTKIQRLQLLVDNLQIDDSIRKDLKEAINEVLDEMYSKGWYDGQHSM